MKKILNFKKGKAIYLFLSIAFAFSSCSKDNGGSTPENPTGPDDPNPGSAVTATFVLPSGEQVEYAFEQSSADNYFPRFYGPNNEGEYQFNSYSGFVKNGVKYELDIAHILVAGAGTYTMFNSSVHDKMRISVNVRDADDNPDNNGSVGFEDFDWVEEFTVDITSFTLIDNGAQVYVEATFSGVLSNYSPLFEQDEVVTMTINSGKINVTFPLWAWSDCPCYD